MDIENTQGKELENEINIQILNITKVFFISAVSFKKIRFFPYEESMGILFSLSNA